MYNSEQLQEKWQPVLNHPDLPQISDSYKRAVTAVILENQEKNLKSQSPFWQRQKCPLVMQSQTGILS